MRKNELRLTLFSARGEASFTLSQRQRLAEKFAVTYVKAPESLSEDRFCHYLASAQVAGITPRSLPQKLSPQFWSLFPSLSKISLPTTGTEWFPMEEALRCGKRVDNLPGYSGQSCAEFTWSLILALQRHLLAANRQVLSGQKEQLRGRDLCGQKLGVIGCGDVGRRVAKIAHAFEMEVWAYDLNEISDLKNLPLEKIVEGADIVSLHLPLTPATRGLFSEALLSRAKPGQLWVNTARPALIDFELILRFLDEQRLGGYAVDQGYLSRDSFLKLASHPEVLAVPHISWYTDESVERQMELWVERLLS